MVHCAYCGKPIRDAHGSPCCVRSSASGEFSPEYDADELGLDPEEEYDA